MVSVQASDIFSAQVQKRFFFDKRLSKLLNGSFLVQPTSATKWLLGLPDREAGEICKCSKFGKNSLVLSTPRASRDFSGEQARLFFYNGISFKRMVC